MQYHSGLVGLIAWKMMNTWAILFSQKNRYLNRIFSGIHSVFRRFSIIVLFYFSARDGPVIINIFEPSRIKSSNLLSNYQRAGAFGSRQQGLRDAQIRAHSMGQLIVGVSGRWRVKRVGLWVRKAGLVQIASWRRVDGGGGWMTEKGQTKNFLSHHEYRLLKTVSINRIRRYW